MLFFAIITFYHLNFHLLLIKKLYAQYLIWLLFMKHFCHLWEEIRSYPLI